MGEIKDKKIALLIDGENVSYKYYKIIIDELEQYGEIIYKRIYGDFAAKQMSKDWIEAMKDSTIEQIQQIAFTTGKNSSDSKLIINAMDILYKGKVDCFCIVSSDGDFTNLAIRLKNDDMVVIGAGENKTPDAFIKACDIFIPLEEISNAEKIDKQDKNKNINELLKICDEIFKESEEGDILTFSTFINELLKKEKKFTPKLYGSTSSKKSTFFKNLKDDKNQKYFEIKLDENNKMTIRRIKTK